MNTDDYLYLSKDQHINVDLFLFFFSYLNFISKISVKTNTEITQQIKYLIHFDSQVLLYLLCLEVVTFGYLFSSF